MPEGLCKNRLCRQPVIPSPRFRNKDYCVSCSIDREIAARKKKEAKPKKCKHCRKPFQGDKPWEKFCTVACKKEFLNESKQGAIERKKERRARRKLKRRTLQEYPSAGFAAKRKQMKLFEAEPRCEITGITESGHIKKFGSGLHLDHIIPARIAAESSKDPHMEVNLMWLSHSLHAQKKGAEEQLKGKGGMYGFILKLKQDNWPMERVKAALEYFELWSERLPI